ncbi:unnamed protein product [Chrysoparadoxa australica]
MNEKDITPSLAHYGSLVACCCKAGQWEIVAELMAQMRTKGIQPDARIYENAMYACSGANKDDMVVSLWELMKADQVYTNEGTCKLAISCLEKLGRTDEVKLARQEMRERGQNII